MGPFDVITWDHLSVSAKSIKRFASDNSSLSLSPSSHSLSPSETVVEGMHPGAFDVGAVLVRASRYRSGRYQRLSDSAFTPDIPRRDFFAMKRLIDETEREKVLHLQQVLSKT
jgi:hypothetical protein